LGESSNIALLCYNAETKTEALINTSGDTYLNNLVDGDCYCEDNLNVMKFADEGNIYFKKCSLISLSKNEN